MIRGVRIRSGWEALEDSLLILKPKTAGQIATGERLKIAGFDFDDTLVRKHDNTLSYSNVVEYLKALFSAGFTLAIMSNETVDHLKNPAAIQKTLDKKMTRIEKFLETVGVPMYCFVATRYDGYRKPSTKDAAKKKPPGGRKMWDTLVKLLDIDIDGIDMDASFYVGDSAGRGGEFSDADLAFAKCVGVTFIHSNDFFKKPLAIISNTIEITQNEKSTEVIEKTSSKEKPGDSQEENRKRSKVVSETEDAVKVESK